MEVDVCSHMGDLIAGPKHKSSSVYVQKLGT